MTRLARLALALALALALQSAAFARVSHELAAASGSSHVLAVENCESGVPNESPSPAKLGHSRACPACLPCHNLFAAIEPKFAIGFAPPISLSLTPLADQCVGLVATPLAASHPARGPPVLS